MKKFLFDIQLFATDVTTAGKTSTLAGRMSVEEAHEYYDRTLTEHVYDEYNLNKYFDEITLPKNNGKSMVFRKLGRYTANMNPLIEGIIPDQDAPMSTYEYRVNLQDYAGYTTFTPDLDIYSLNSGWATRIQKNQASALGEELQKKAYKILCTSKNRWVAGATVSSTSDLASLRASATEFNLDDFRKIRTFLQRTKVKPYDNGDYIVLISPEVAESLFSLAKSDSKFSFVEIMNYQKTDTIINGEIGKWMGFRFVVDNAIGVIATSSSNTTGTNIHGCLILGKYRGEKGAKLVKLEGYGRPETIIKDTTTGGARENPVNQIGSIGWKILGWGGTVLYSEAVMVYECVAGAVASEFSDSERDQLIRSTDGNGTSATAPTANTAYENGTKLTGKMAVLTVKALYGTTGTGKAVEDTGASGEVFLFDTDTTLADVQTGTGYTLYTYVASTKTATAVTTTAALSTVVSGNTATLYRIVASK